MLYLYYRVFLHKIREITGAAFLSVIYYSAHAHRTQSVTEREREREREREKERKI